MKYGLSEKQFNEIVSVIKKDPTIEKAVLFGSRTMDTFKEASDVDIAIFGKETTAFTAQKLKSEIEDETYLPFFFDVVAYNTISNDDLKKHIDKKGIVVYRRNGNVEAGLSEWTVCKLADIAEVQTGPFGSQLKNEQYITGGTPVVTARHINNFRITEFNYPSVKDEDKNRLTKYILKTGDIVFTRVGSVDLSAWVKPSQNGWMFSSRMLRVRPNSEVHSRFLGYFFQQKQFREYILNIAPGVTTPSINTEILQGIIISFPPLPVQKAIASVLSSLDDKIDLLYRQNKTLEAMAETLFRQWFVEEAQEDWPTVKLGDYVKTNVSSISRDFPLSEISYLDTGSLNEGKIDGFQCFNLTGAPSRAKRIVKHNDVLISTVRPNQKHYGIIKNPEDDIIVSTEFCVITCEKLNPHFVYIFLTNNDMTEYLHSIAEGSTLAYPSLKPSDIENLEFQIAPQKKLMEFEKYVDNAWDKIEYNHNQLIILEKLRDSLLPKLMSGEVKIS